MQNHSHVSTSTSTRKENAPMSRGAGTLHTTPTSPSRKRKLSEQSNNAIKVASADPLMKKVKLAPQVMIDAPLSTGDEAQILSNGHDTDKFPNGFYYCHQCNKKRDAAAAIQCTKLEALQKRCKAKYCPACLLNRYGEDVEDIKKTTAGRTPEHCQEAAYVWTNLTTVARRAGAGSAATLLSEDPNRVGILPGKGQQLPPPEKKPKAKPTEASSSAIGSAPKPKLGRPKAKPKIRVLPSIKWSRIPLDGALPLEEAKARIGIREFMLRFACIMNAKSGLPKKALEELDEIAGETMKGDRELNSEGEDDEKKLAGWISDVCVRGMVVGMLGLIQDDEADADIQKLIKDTIKDLQTSGANLTKVWTSLSTLRSSIKKYSAVSTATELLASLPDPLPPPSSHQMMRTTRHAVNATVLVAQSSQMVPVVIALVEATLRTEAVRGEIEDGVKDGKEKARESKELMKAEMERWDKVKEKETNHKSKEATQRREQHRAIINDLESTLKIAMPAYAPRFDGPIGTDIDGRVYWALTPSVTERELSIEAILDKEQKPKRPKRMVPEHRDAMKKWSWFMAVWEPSADVQSDDASAEGSEAGKDEGCWFGLCDPAHIKTVADWIEIRAETEVDCSASSDEEEADGMQVSGNALPHELKALVGGLRAYADMLEWRTAKDTDTSNTGDESSSTSGPAPVSSSDFYKK
ncbi:hypothetical protein HWV62_36793 [Athelia sp. TMB]|nr:hypothetical protein HWV62_36793 [Athelia sp. TMB]